MKELRIKAGKGPGISFEKDNVFLIAGFFISAVNGYLALTFFALILLNGILRKDSVYLLKGLSLFILRTTAMNTRLFSVIIFSGGVRYFIIIAFIFGMFLTCKVKTNNVGVYNEVLGVVTLFCLYVFISSIFYSSYPIVSVVKLAMYYLAFIAVLRVIAGNDEYNWNHYFTSLFCILFFLSMFAFPFMSLRTKNGRAFQGIFNHPNVFAIYGAAFVSLLLANKTIKRPFKVFMIVAVLVMQFFSEARTGLLSTVFIIGLFFLILYRNRVHKTIFAVLAIFLIVGIIVVAVPELASRFIGGAESFLYKSVEDNLFYSRRGQIRLFNQKISDSPIFGTGFMTPHIQGMRSISLDFDLYVEQGNVFLAVLGETGIVGLVLWVITYALIFIKGVKAEKIHYFIIPFVISMGEMAFFSTNSIGFLFFVFFGIFLFGKEAEGLDSSELAYE